MIVILAGGWLVRVAGVEGRLFREKRVAHPDAVAATVGAGRAAGAWGRFLCEQGGDAEQSE
jgi:hypothetical protein